MKNCKCEHWQTCPVCYPRGFDEAGNRKLVEIPPTRDEMLARIKELEADRDALKAENIALISSGLKNEAERGNDGFLMTKIADLVQERDSLAMQNQQMREALEVVDAQLIEGKIFTQQMHPRPYWRYSVSEALALPDTSDIIKRNDAAVLFNAAKNLRLSEGSVTPFYNSMRTAIERVEIMAHELDKS